MSAPAVVQHADDCPASSLLTLRRGLGELGEDERRRVLACPHWWHDAARVWDRLAP